MGVEAEVLGTLSVHRVHRAPCLLVRWRACWLFEEIKVGSMLTAVANRVGRRSIDNEFEKRKWKCGNVERMSTRLCVIGYHLSLDIRHTYIFDPDSARLELHTFTMNSTRHSP